MKKSRLILHYRHLYTLFRSHFSKTAERQGVEDIHRLRVTIKKLRALLTLMEITGKRYFIEKDYFTLLSGLFSKAGDVRESQVNLSMLAKHKSDYLLPYSKYLKKTMQQESRELLAEIRAFNMDELERLHMKLLLKMESIPDDKIAKKAGAYFPDKLKKVRKLKSRTMNDRRLHEIRIQLKSVSEILSLLDDLNPSPQPDKLKDDIKSLNKAIGKWHDAKVLVSSMKDFANQYPEEENILYIKKLIRKIKSKNDMVCKKIYKLLDKYITRQRIKSYEALGIMS